MRVGFIGLGAMGTAMAANLAKAGHEVRAWNRSESDPIEDVARVASPGEAFDAEAVFTMLSDDAAIRAVVLDGGLLDQAPEGCVHVVTSTISVAFADELARLHEAAGVGYVSAPVLGRPDAAAAAELNILIAGEALVVERVRPLLGALGKKVWPLGDDPKQANAVKIACNMMITMAIEAMAEAVVLTEANGVGRHAFFDLILGTLFGSRSYRTYSANIAADRYEPGFRARLGLKDLGLASAAAQAAGRQLPMLDAVQARLAETVEAGMGERDWSAMADFTINHEGKTA